MKKNGNKKETGKTLRKKIGDDAVKAKTGKNWKEWFSILDKAGAKKMSHKEIVHWLGVKYGKQDWWWQMVTVTYEQERGLRELHQTTDGFALSCSKTINATQEAVYQAWFNEKLRSGWLPASSLSVTKATPPKSMRMRWTANDTPVVVDFYRKSPVKCQVVVQQSKLTGNAEVEKMKKYWGKKLEELKGLLES
ncbi:MAG: DUF4287 domain-containing protein [Bacteroidota bacterium]